VATGAAGVAAGVARRLVAHGTVHRRWPRARIDAAGLATAGLASAGLAAAPPSPSPPAPRCRVGTAGRGLAAGGRCIARFAGLVAVVTPVGAVAVTVDL